MYVLMPFFESMLLTASDKGSVTCSPSLKVAGKSCEAAIREESRELLGTMSDPSGCTLIPVIVIGRYPTLVIVTSAISRKAT